MSALDSFRYINQQSPIQVDLWSEKFLRNFTFKTDLSFNFDLIIQSISTRSPLFRFLFVATNKICIYGLRKYTSVNNSAFRKEKLKDM